MSGLPIPWSNISSHDNSCPADLSRNSCFINPSELSKKDVVATIRLVISVLSILGSLSIILPALIRRQATSPKVHPIFVLSIADCMAACLWVVGSVFWFSGLTDRRWCFLPSLLTVILECVTVNLTLVYALFSYATLKHKDLNRILVNVDVERVWHPIKTLTAYIIAWFTPAAIVMIAFGIVGGIYGIVRDANSCSCWCVPQLGNVLPLAKEGDWVSQHLSQGLPTSSLMGCSAEALSVKPGGGKAWEHGQIYFSHMRKLLVTYGTLLGTNYLVVFVLLVIIYIKVLRRIRALRKRYEQTRHFQPNYGAVDVILIRGQSQAKKRVVYFLITFIVTGLANVILSYTFMVYESIRLLRGVTPPRGDDGSDHMTAFPMTLYVVQSLTAPLQGFLNALVYGWTREDFRKTINLKRVPTNADVATINTSSDEEEVDDSSVLLSEAILEGRAKAETK